MTAELLREAAALMRERAEAATPGPWEAFRANHQHSGKPVYGVTRDLAVDYETDVFASTRCDVADAEHIASWHPDVALAVADWLDATAFACDMTVAFYGPANQVMFSSTLIVEDKAFAVARAYLGRDS